MKRWNIGILECWKGIFIQLFHYYIIPVILLISTFISANAQVKPTNFFRLPLDTALVLSGTFAEIRTNHFHSGIDISTNETEGKDVLAAADGYVSRIKVAPDGFGKALYITHRNGYVTVYGTLQRYDNTIEIVLLAAS